MSLAHHPSSNLNFCTTFSQGVVDIIEFQAVMEKVATRTGKPYSFANVRRMFLEADLNGDGYIDYDEWMTVQKEQKARKLAAARATLPVATGTEVPPVPQSRSATTSGSAGAAAGAHAGFQAVRMSELEEDEDDHDERRPLTGSDASQRPYAGSGSGAAAAVRSLEGLRDLLASLASAAANEDTSLRREAEFLLQASLDERRSMQRRQQQQDADGDDANGGAAAAGGGDAGAKRAAQQRLSLELASVLAATRGPPTRQYSSAGSGIGVDRGSGVGGRAPSPAAASYSNPFDGAGANGNPFGGGGGEEEEEEGEESDEERGNAAGSRVPDSGGATAAASAAGNASAASSLMSLSALSSPIEILITQSQYTGLTAGILVAMSEDWEVGKWPTLALEWQRYCSWMDILNIDLKTLGDALSRMPQLDSLYRFGLALRAVPLATVYLWVALLTPLLLSLFMVVMQARGRARKARSPADILSPLALSSFSHSRSLFPPPPDSPLAEAAALRGVDLGAHERARPRHRRRGRAERAARPPSHPQPHAAAQHLHGLPCRGGDPRRLLPPAQHLRRLLGAAHRGKARVARLPHRHPKI